METNHRPLNMLRCKVAIVGDACVGKTALVQSFHSGNYPKNYIMTSWVDFCVKQVKVPDTDVAVELYLFDTAGQSVFNQTDADTAYFENVNFVMAVYDVSNKGSFESINTWLSRAKSRRPPNAPPLPGVLVANKVDLRGEPGDYSARAVVTPAMGVALAKQLGLEYFEASAALQQGATDPFHFMAYQFHKKYNDTVDHVARDV